MHIEEDYESKPMYLRFASIIGTEFRVFPTVLRRHSRELIVISLVEHFIIRFTICSQHDLYVIGPR